MIFGFQVSWGSHGNVSEVLILEGGLKALVKMCQSITQAVSVRAHSTGDCAIITVPKGQSKCQSINQSITQAVSGLVSVALSQYQSVNQSSSQYLSVNQSVNQSSSQYLSVNHAGRLRTDFSAIITVHHSVSLPLRLFSPTTYLFKHIGQKDQ